MSSGWLGLMLLLFLGALLMVAVLLNMLRRRRCARIQRRPHVDELKPHIVVPLQESGVLPFDEYHMDEDTLPYTALVISQVDYAPLLVSVPADDAAPPAPAAATLEHDPDADTFTIAPGDFFNPQRHNIRRLIAYLENQPARSAD